MYFAVKSLLAFSSTAASDKNQDGEGM